MIDKQPFNENMLNDKLNSLTSFDNIIKNLNDSEKEDVRNYILEKRYKENDKIQIINQVKSMLELTYKNSEYYKITPMLYDPQDFNPYFKILENNKSKYRIKIIEDI